VLQAAELPAKYLDDPRIQRVFGQAQQVRGQWRQALQHFQRAGQDRDELEPALCWRVGLIAFAQGEFDEVQALTQRARLDGENTLDETRVLALSASAYRMAGDLLGTRKVAIQARAAAQRCGQARAWSGVHHVFGLIAAAEGDWRQADAHCTEALRTAEATDDLLQLMWIRACRAFHQYEMGAPRQALADAQLVLSLSERCEDPFLIAHALTTRGRASVRIGMLEEAAANFVTAIDLFKRIGSRFLAWPLCGFGDLHRTRGQVVRARTAYEEALALAEPHHDVFSLSSALIGLARISVSDDLRFARELATRAVELGEGLRKVQASLARGWVELMGGDRSRASADATRAAVAARQRRDGPGLAEAITLSALASSNTAVDAAPLREAIEIWRETGCRLEEATTRVVAARFGTSFPSVDAHFAEQMLRDYGVDVERHRAAGPLGVLASSAPAVLIQTLGAFRVTRDGVPVATIDWKSKKARELLKILVIRRRPIPRDQLMEQLWPQVDSALASNRLSVLLSTIRDVLQPHPAGEDPLVTEGGAVSLNPAQVRVDVEDFLAQATAALDADQANERDATAQLIAAVAAHTGNFLEDDPSLHGASGLAEQVKTTHIGLLRVLAARLRDAGETDAVVLYTLRLLEQDCYDERAHLSLITVLLEAGRPDQARHHYQNYIRRMAEIDVRPSPLPDTASRALAGG
jgi:DNA-binding SARP family transcriptional activator